MSDSGGQIVGGPVIGVIGNLVSIRAALLAGAAALGPALGLLMAANRRVRAVPATELTAGASLGDDVPAAVPENMPGERPAWPRGPVTGG
jgi:hypothetical protein